MNQAAQIYSFASAAFMMTHLRNSQHMPRTGTETAVQMYLCEPNNDRTEREQRHLIGQVTGSDFPLLRIFDCATDQLKRRVAFQTSS